MQRCQEDEQYLRLLGDITGKEPDGSINYLSNYYKDMNLSIYDARPWNDAAANKLIGKGYENITYYKNCEIKFLNIHNIHKVREAYKKIMQLCQKYYQF